MKLNSGTVGEDFLLPKKNKAKEKRGGGIYPKRPVQWLHINEPHEGWHLLVSQDLRLMGEM